MRCVQCGQAIENPVAPRVVLCSDCVAAEFAEPSALPATVKRADLFGHVEDTYATEGELNGWRAQQAHLVGKQGGLL